MQDNNCSIKNCCSKASLIAALILAVLTWLYEYVVHGVLLMDMYFATTEMWRDPAEMEQMMLPVIAYHLVMAVLFTKGYFWWRANLTADEGCPFAKSMMFGLWVGLLIGVPSLAAYIWMPFETVHIPLYWMLSEVVKWVLAGALLTKFYRA